MKALQIMAAGRSEIVDVERPRPGPGEALVQVEAVTTCPQWDLHIMGGTPMFPGAAIGYPYMPGQPGHEAVGHVVAVGEGVQDLAPGNRVVAWHDPGHELLGSYAEFVVRDQHELLPAPDDLPAEALASLELAMCVQVSFEALLLHDAVAGRRIGISGLGAAGLVAIQLARAYGAREVIGFDLQPSRRELAAALGADTVLDPRDLTELDRRTSGDALESAVECAGSAPSLQFLMDRTRWAVAQFGVLRDDVRFGWRHRGLALLGYRPQHRGAAVTALEHVVAGTLDLRPLVTHTLPLTEYERGLALLRDQNAIKICFQP